MRRKSGDMPDPAPASPMDEGGDMGGEMPTDSPAPDPGSDSQPTAFLPKELGGGKVWKAGEEIVLKINAVDPQTGELQVSYASDGGEESDEQSPAMSAMDKAMPDDGEGGGY